MKGFDSRFLDELKSKSDIVQTVGKYVSLERRGNKYWGCCPFHHEKTPSFCVDATEQFYYCFGCHQGGDVIKFVQEIEATEFGEAVKILAEAAKMEVPTVDVNDAKIKESREKRANLLAILKDTARYYFENLRSGKAEAHLQYLQKRGIDSATVTAFGMGASLDYDGLVRFLKEKGYKLEDGVTAGVLGRTERNGAAHYYDALAGRLIIPVIDALSNVVAFTGRIIEKKENVGKYVNTKETPVFTKGKTLFNLNNVKKLKNSEGVSSLIMVEGHMDVISLYKSGIKNVVASMGTALTKDQARMIKRYVDTVYISYDGDGAGQKATVRGLDILEGEGLNVKVVSLPAGMDPDEVVLKYGKEKYEELVKEAKPLIDFKLDVLEREYDIKTPDGKRAFVREAVKVVKSSPSPAVQEDLLKVIREKTGITYDSLRRELEGVPAAADGKPLPVNAETGVGAEPAEAFVLYAFLFKKRFTEDVDLRDISFSEPAYAYLKDYLLDEANKGLSASSALTAAPPEYEEKIKDVFRLEAADKPENEKKMFADCVKKLQQKSIARDVDKLKKMFVSETDVEKRNALAAEIQALLKTKRG